MDQHETGQVASKAAQIYDEFFVPALFAQWPAKLLRQIPVRNGQRILDVACGTGVLACAAAEAVGSIGQVTGVDINEGMLEVAKARSKDVNWHLGSAEKLPFAVNSFDAVVSQFGLMFFANRRQAISEMLRVMRPNGALVIAVWATLEATPGYLAVARMLEDLFGPQVAQSVRAPFCLGDVTELESLFVAAGVPSVEVQTLQGKAHFPSVESWMHTDVRGWTLADQIDDAGYAKILKHAPIALAEFVQADGSVKFAVSAHIVTVKPRTGTQ